jgi:hypothetical protein
MEQMGLEDRCQNGQLEVTAATVLEIAMDPAGGQAIMFEPT